MRQAYVAALRADMIVRRLDSNLLRLLNVATRALDLRMELQAEHLHRRRPRQAHSLLAALPEVLDNIRYLGTQSRCNRQRTAVGMCTAERLVLVGLKFFPAHLSRSGDDEAWVTTAYFLGQSELRRQVSNGTLRPRSASA